MSRLKELAAESKRLGIQLIQGDEQTRSMLGIHLENPTLREIAEGVQIAERDCIPFVFLYQRPAPKSFHLHQLLEPAQRTWID